MHTRSSSGPNTRPGGGGVLAGLFTGAFTGLTGALISVPLRGLAGVGDRALVNGLTVVGGAVLLWVLVGLLHVALRREPGMAHRAAMATARAVALVGALAVYTALDGFAVRLASLVEPLLLRITLGGAVLFLAVVSRSLRVPLRVLAPAGTVAAIAVALVVAMADRTPPVHYALSKQIPVGTVTRLGRAANGGQDATPPFGTAPRSEPLHFTVTSGSEAAFTVHEKLTRLPSPSDAVGKTQAISGDVYLDPALGLAASPTSKLSVDLSTLTSDSRTRDNFIKRNTLQTDQYPTATFTIASIDGFPTAYKDGAQVNVKLAGTMQVHGVDKPVTWTGTARYANAQLEAVLSTDVTLTDFGMTPPQVRSVQSVDDKVHLDLHALLQAG
jgi:polyisoprenoid-binding protein YceI